MWGWTPAGQVQLPVQNSEAMAKREAEKKIEDSGLGECVYCDEELIKNERGVWESEFLVEYCTDARDHKHRPRVKYKENK